MGRIEKDKNDVFRIYISREEKWKSLFSSRGDFEEKSIGVLEKSLFRFKKIDGEQMNMFGKQEERYG